jgi:hypothetical protein
MALTIELTQPILDALVADRNPSPPVPDRRTPEEFLLDLINHSVIGPLLARHRGYKRSELISLAEQLSEPDLLEVIALIRAKSAGLRR